MLICDLTKSPQVVQLVLFVFLQGMLQLDQYQSEGEALKVLVHESLAGHEDYLMSLFIKRGPQVLRQLLGAKSDYVWTVVFDYLVFQHDVLKRGVRAFHPFFRDFAPIG